jgi:DHA3 family macrolide efflux protein-like MFS transporter
MREQSWKDRITRFLAAQMISLLGSSIVQYAIIWHITRETASGTMLTLSTVCGFAPQIIVSLFAGVLLDRYNRKYIIMIADTAIALATLLLSLSLLRGNDSLVLMFVVLAVRSLGGGLQTPAVNAVIPQLVPKDRLMRVNGIYATLISIMTFLSPAFAGMLLGLAGLGVTLLVDVTTALIGVSITATVFFPPVETDEQPASSGFEDFKRGFAYLRSHVFVKRLLVFQGLILFLISPVFLIALVTERSFGGGVWRFASTEMAYGLGCILGGAIISWWGGFKNKMTTALLSAVTFGILLSASGFASFWVFAGLMFLIGIGSPMYDTSFITSLQERVEPEMHGRIFSFVQITVAAMLPAGMVVFGPLADIISIQTIFVISGVSILGLTAFARFVLHLERV